jgi:hypothetical protein
VIAVFAVGHCQQESGVKQRRPVTISLHGQISSFQSIIFNGRHFHLGFLRRPKGTSKNWYVWQFLRCKCLIIRLHLRQNRYFFEEPQKLSGRFVLFSGRK